MDVCKQLNIILNKTVNEDQILELFKDYKKVFLKDKLQQMKVRNADMA